MARVITHWCLHDLRRTLRSGLARLGVPREVARKVVNHRNGKVDWIYDRYEYLVESRDALDRWQRHARSLVNRGNVAGNTGLDLAA